MCVYYLLEKEHISRYTKYLDFVHLYEDCSSTTVSNIYTFHSSIPIVHILLYKIKTKKYHNW